MTVVEYLENATRVAKMFNKDIVIGAGTVAGIGAKLALECYKLKYYEANMSMFEYPEIVEKYIDKGQGVEQIAVIMNARDDNIIVDNYINTDFSSYDIYLIALSLALGDDPSLYEVGGKINPMTVKDVVLAVCISCGVLNIKYLDEYIAEVANGVTDFDVKVAVGALLLSKKELRKWTQINCSYCDDDVCVYTKVLASVGFKYGRKCFADLRKKDSIYGALQMLYSTGIWDKVKEDYPQYFMGEV